MLIAVIVISLLFGLVNGVHDAGNAIAAPVVTRAVRPGTALLSASFFHVAGALLAGTAVATTVASFISVEPHELLRTVGAAALGACTWSLLTLKAGIPCSSGHCLVGSLTGAALIEGGLRGVRWGGLHGLHPVGFFGSLLWLVLSSVLAAPLAFAGIRLSRRTLHRASRGATVPVRRAEIVTSAALAFAHGSNDAQKVMGLVAAALLASHHLSRLLVPFWVQLVCALALAAGTALGGWRVVMTLGRGIYPLRALEGLVSQATASGIVLAASILGAPVSTTDVVAPAIVGVGAGRRLHHVRWQVVRLIVLAWLFTLPACAVIGAACVLISRPIT